MEPIDVALDESEVELPTEPMLLNVGPSHPAMHGTVRMVLDLEAALRGVPVAEVGAAVDRYFAASRPDLLTIAPEDFRKVIEEAVAAGVTS